MTFPFGEVLEENLTVDINPLVAALDLEGIDEWERRLLAEQAREYFTPDGFKAFMRIVYGFEVLPHMEPAVEVLFEKHFIVIEAYVESAKTTTFTEAFFAFYIGHHPIETNMLIQVSGGKAEETAEAVANLISLNENWKLVFPHIVAYETPWGKDAGYLVRATQIKEDGKWQDLSEAQWRKLIVGRRDPTFIGLGYKSRAIVGKRISGLLIVDDIHDENNTMSERELSATLKRLKSTILTRAKKTAWIIFIGTPWIEGDTIDFVKNLQRYTHIKIPVYTEGQEGDKDAFYYPRISEWVVPSWPEQYDLAYLEQKWDELQEVEFARMLLLDLTKTGERVFFFQDFSSDNISPIWPTGGGVDFASILKASQKNDPNRAFFAMAFVAKKPNGGAVVTGGVRERCTPDDAEAHMVRAQQTHENWLGSIVEQDGKGEVFIFGLQQRYPRLRFIPMRTRGRGKEMRLEREMSPWFSNGIVKISDADTPFLNALRKEMRDYPHNRYFDCLDAVYWALRGMPDVLKMQSMEDSELPPLYEKRKKENPFNALLGRK